MTKFIREYKEAGVLKGKRTGGKGKGRTGASIVLEDVLSRPS